MRYRTVLLVIPALIIHSCSLLPDQSQEAPVARAFDSYLYPSDLATAIPEGSSKEDSVILAKRYIDNWVKEQLMVQRANQELSDDQKDFEKQIQEYHHSLLIYSYRQKLLLQKLDTVVHEEEVQAYYDENLGNFLLSQPVIKGTYVKVPLSAPRIAELRSWSRSNQPEDLDQMEKYCINYAEKFNDFNDSWIYYSSIKSQFPMSISQPSRFLSYNRNLDAEDSLYRYFLHISDQLPEGDPTPLSLVRANITNIILNKRKIKFIQELDQRVYSEGVSKNQFEIFQ